MTLNANPNTQERNPMSPNVGNFVHDLVEMAKAMETLPQVQQELEQTKVERQSLLDRIDRINADLEQSRNYGASLEQRNHDLEVQRDDAEMRFLELDEKAHSVMGMLIDFEGKAKGARLILDPPKPEPEPVVLPSAQETFHATADLGPDPSEVPPIQTSTNPSTSGTGDGGKSDWQHDKAETSTLPPTQPPVSQGQGEVNPTVSTGPQDTAVPLTHVPQEDVGSTTMETSSADPKPSGPYANKRYFDHPTYVTFGDWIDGGGTEESYLWTPTSF